LPDEEKQGVCVSLKEYAARILKPNISTVLSNAMTDRKNKKGSNVQRNQKLLKSQRRTTR
jgi:hypothetical protein